MSTQTVLGEAGEQAFGEGENAFVLGRMQAREAAAAAALVADYVRLFGVADRKSLRRWMR